MKVKRVVYENFYFPNIENENHTKPETCDSQKNK